MLENERARYPRPVSGGFLPQELSLYFFGCRRLQHFKGFGCKMMEKPGRRRLPDEKRIETRPVPIPVARVIGRR